MHSPLFDFEVGEIKFMKKILITCLIISLVLSVAACGGANNDNAVILENPVSASGVGTTDSSAENEDPQSEEDAANLSETGDLQSEDYDLQNESNDSELSVDNGGFGQNSNILVAYFSRVGNTEWEDNVDAVTSASLNVENGEFVGNAEYLAKMAAEVTGGDLFLIQTEETYPSDYRETTDVATVEQSNNARPALASHVDNMDQYDTVVLIYPNWWGTLPMPLYTFLEEYDFAGKTILPLCTHEGSRMGNSVGAIATICPDAVLLDGLDVRGSAASSAQFDVETWISNSGILE